MTVTDKSPAEYSTDQKNFTDHMFNIKLEEKSYKMSFKTLPLKIQRSKNRQGAQCDEGFSREELTVKSCCLFLKRKLITQPAFTCSKSTMETSEQCVKSVQS